MQPKLKSKLIEIAKGKISNDDPSHDIHHALRVLNNVEIIGRKENADLEVLIPAALFHDVIIYPKNDPRATQAQQESADFTKQLLLNITGFPKSKVEPVVYAISVCSFSKGIIPDTLEAKILQDADKLEACGAVSVMRTFSSTGQMKRAFYHPQDPFCKQREPEQFKYAIDIFYTRLLKVSDKMHTETAKEMAQQRTDFLYQFLKQLELELKL